MSFSKVAYVLPVPEGSITKIVAENKSHEGAFEGSVDFAVKLSTPVLAAAKGKVVRVRDDSNKYGKDPSFGQDVNYITIEHTNRELSEYLHLKKGSALVEVGEFVKSGQKIASTGLSGWLYAPHLHFMVYEKAPKPFQCKTIKFIHPLPK